MISPLLFKQSEYIMKILVCGGAGFIGSNFIRYMLNKYPDYEIHNYDKLTYAGNLDNLSDVKNNPMYSFSRGDILNFDQLGKLINNGFDAIINFAAETHVDNSIYSDSRSFIDTNIVGVHTILELCKKYKMNRYVQISTDEVYGSLKLGETNIFTEDTKFAPNSPYAASKAAADLICRSYFKTFGVPVIITNCSNNYGPYQYPEKLIPVFISRALKDELLPLYGDGQQVRDWIHVLDHCSAIDLVLHKGKVGETYNIGANKEKPNIEIAKLILSHLGKPESLITFVEDRLAHDVRYAIDSSKIMRELDWKPNYNFEESIKETVGWYKNNTGWIEKVKKKKEDINKHIKIKEYQKESILNP